MIVLPPGWAVNHRMDGLELIHPEGRAIAALDYRERLRPLARVGALVRRHLGEVPGFTPSELPDIVERLTTVEGEHAALATVGGGFQGHAAQLDFGFVFGDDFYALFAATTHDPGRFEQASAMVRQLVATDTHELGLRRRRFEYSPPRDWQPLVRGFITDWFPPGYPHDSIHLTAYPANPRRFTPREILAILLGPNRTVVREANAPLSTSAGLQGEVFEVALAVADRTVVKLCVVLEDTRYTYTLDVTAGSEQALATHRDTLGQVAASIQPVPQMQEIRHDHHYAAQAFWID